MAWCSALRSMFVSVVALILQVVVGDLCTTNYGMQCVGDDIPGGSIEGVETAANCCALCGQRPGCNGWTLHVTNRTCYLKTACRSLQIASAAYQSCPFRLPAEDPLPPVVAEASGHHQGPVNIQIDGKVMNLHVAALLPDLVTSSRNGDAITMKYGEQTRAFVVKDPINDMPVDKYFSFNLLGKELSYDIDLSTVGCSCNAALFFTSMPGYTPNGSVAKGAYNPYYCDANNVGGVWCWEHDAIESNMYTMATTPHKCESPPGAYIAKCDGVGCSTNAFHMDPNGMCPESRCTIDTRYPFRIHQKHTVDALTQKMIRIVNTLVQNNRTFEWEICTQDPTYAQAMTDSMRDMKMVFQLWGTRPGRMVWLDSMTGCSGACNTDTAAVTFANIELNTLPLSTPDAFVLYS